MGLNPDDLTDDTPPPPRPPTPDSWDDPAFVAWKSDPANAQHTRTLRGENARYRVRARTAEQKLAALDPDGAGAAMLAGKDKEIRDLKIGRALDGAARKHGVADSDLLAAYMDRAGHLKDLDVDAPDFAEALSDLVEEVSISKPALRGGQPSDIPPTTGARFTAPTRVPPRQLTRQDLATMSPEAIDAARGAGLLNELLGRQG